MYDLEKSITLNEIYVTVNIKMVLIGSRRIGNDREVELILEITHSRTIVWLVWNNVRESNRHLIALNMRVWGSLWCVLTGNVGGIMFISLRHDLINS